MLWNLHPLVLKVSQISASLIFGFGAGDILGLDGWLKVLIGGVLAIILAYISRQPAMEQAKLSKAQAKLSEQAILDAEQIALIKTATDVHQVEVHFLQDRIIYNSKLEKIARVRAHRALGELQRVDLYARKLQLLMCQEGLTVPPFEFKSYGEIVGELDEQLARLIDSEPVAPSLKN
jgi:hypothetical protein